MSRIIKLFEIAMAKAEPSVRKKYEKNLFTLLLIFSTLDFLAPYLASLWCGVKLSTFDF